MAGWWYNTGHNCSIAYCSQFLTHSIDITKDLTDGKLYKTMYIRKFDAFVSSCIIAIRKMQFHNLSDDVGF
jgi:hypothetical protein